jgi:hypothetical protein
MKIPIPPGGRVLFRVDPVPGESPRGYLCRVASEHSYCGPLSLAQIADLPPFGLDREDRVAQMAYVLRLTPDEWRPMCYRSINKERGRFRERLFYDKRVSCDDLNYRRSRLCPKCLRDRPIWWAVWDLSLVTACPIHRCLLVNRCPACERNLSWQRRSIHQCRCGFDFRNLIPETANRDLVAIHAVIHRAAGFSAGAEAEADLTDYGFPPEMIQMQLGSLLKLILFLGSVKERLRKQQPFAGTDLKAAIEINRTAVMLLSNWPVPLCERLRSVVLATAEDPSTLTFRNIYGNFYRHLFRVLPRSEFGFLHDAFERFVMDDWDGFIRGQHRYFSSVTRQNAQWMTANEAEKTARTTSERIVDLVRQDHIQGRFLNLGGRTECWIRRESLNQWMAARDAELACYMVRPEAMRTLGLRHTTIMHVASAELVRCVKGPAHNFPDGDHFFLREDVLKIKHAFEKHAVSVNEYSKPTEIIALRHAMKNYLGRGLGLVAVIRAVVDSHLQPIGYTKRFPGITGYLFLSEDLRKYRPVPNVKTPPEGFLNYREAAAVLEVQPAVVRGMVAQGILIATETRFGLSKLVPAADVRHFADEYVSATVLAKRFKMKTQWVAYYLKKTGTPFLSVPLLEKGKGPTLFLLREVAQRLPSAGIIAGKP